MKRATPSLTKAPVREPHRSGEDFRGWTELSRQAIERSSIPVLNTTLEALAMEAGKRKKIELRAAVADVIAARKAVAANGGVVVLGSTLAASSGPLGRRTHRRRYPLTTH